MFIIAKRIIHARKKILLAPQFVNCSKSL